MGRVDGDITFLPEVCLPASLRLGALLLLRVPSRLTSFFASLPAFLVLPPLVSGGDDNAGAIGVVDEDVG
jgi:hypothetical protein